MMNERILKLYDQATILEGNGDYVAGELAKREWVGLTDEEIKEFDNWHDNREEEVGWCKLSEIVAYIEAKLKEKNR